MPKPINDRIVELRARKNQLTVRLDTLESRSKKEGRKRDTRRKIIVGGAVLAYMEKDHAFAEGGATNTGRALARLRFSFGGSV